MTTSTKKTIVHTDDVQPFVDKYNYTLHFAQTITQDAVSHSFLVRTLENISMADDELHSGECSWHTAGHYLEPGDENDREATNCSLTVRIR